MESCFCFYFELNTRLNFFKHKYSVVKITFFRYYSVLDIDIFLQVD